MLIFKRFWTMCWTFNTSGVALQRESQLKSLRERVDSKPPWVWVDCKLPWGEGWSQASMGVGRVNSKLPWGRVDGKLSWGKVDSKLPWGGSWWHAPCRESFGRNAELEIHSLMTDKNLVFDVGLTCCTVYVWPEIYWTVLGHNVIWCLFRCVCSRSWF